MKKFLAISIRTLLLMTVLTGIVYPLLITAFAKVFYPVESRGSLVLDRSGRIIGSALIGQAADSAKFFHPRPSAVNYQTIPSGASNYSWSENRLKNLVTDRRASFLRENGLSDTTRVPAEMLTASASGLDPHISPRAAFLQAGRIAQARHYSDHQRGELNALIAKMTEKPQYGVFGEERINVLLLNLELEEIK